MRLVCSAHPFEIGRKKQGLARVPATRYSVNFEVGTATPAE